MKKLFFLIVLPLLLIANITFGGEADLVGTWSVEGTCLRTGAYPGPNYDPYADGDTEQQTDPIVIVWQENGLFKGYVCGVETPNGIFFGTIDGKKITMTQWDAIVYGQLNGKGDEITFVSHHAQKHAPSAPGTCIGVANKESDDFTCDPANSPSTTPPYWPNWQ
jgi:hypothetical protein